MNVKTPITGSVAVVALFLNLSFPA